MKNEYPTIQLNGWKLWPAAAMFNYRYIPLNLRVLFLNLIALGWCASSALSLRVKQRCNTEADCVHKT